VQNVSRYLSLFIDSYIVYPDVAVFFSYCNDNFFHCLKRKCCFNVINFSCLN